MPAFDEDDGYRVVLVAVLATLIIGFFLYTFGRQTGTQVASRWPAIERTVPAITPDQPRI